MTLGHHSNNQSHQDGLDKGPIVVIKVGTSSLIRSSCSSLNLTAFAGLAETVRDLTHKGYRIILISSGAVGVGCQRLNLDHKPSEIAKKQALAAVGQVHLMRCYEDMFNEVGLKIAQVLLTLDNLASRQQFLNARATFEELLNYGVIPVVNENDTVAVEQLRIGNNDSLAAQVANLVQADWLFLLTDVDALYTSNPNVDPDAKPIRVVEDPAALQVDTKEGGTEWGTGGMTTKITAAQHATAAGTKMVICQSDPDNVVRVLAGEQIGTIFLPANTPVRGRKRWILNLPAKGRIMLDPGAVAAVRDHGSSLFASGIVAVEGPFNHQDAVTLCDSKGKEIGRGLVNYTAEELVKIKGLSSRVQEETLGYAGPEQAIHGANICLLPTRASQASGMVLSHSHCSEGSSLDGSGEGSEDDEGHREGDYNETDTVGGTEGTLDEGSPKGPLSRSGTPALSGGVGEESWLKEGQKKDGNGNVVAAPGEA